MDTAKLPTRLHELYPLDILPEEGLPTDGEEDFFALDKISDRIIQKLEDDYTKKIFPAQVVMTVNTLPAYNSRSCPFWSCPSGSVLPSFSDLLTHLEHAHPDTTVQSLKLSATEKKEAIWKPSFLTHFVIKKAPKYAGVFRVCPEAILEINDEELRLSVLYNRMIKNRVAQGLLTKEQAKERLRENCRKLADFPRELPDVLNGANEFEQACLLLDGEMTALEIFEGQDPDDEDFEEEEGVDEQPSEEVAEERGREEVVAEEDEIDEEPSTGVEKAKGPQEDVRNQEGRHVEDEAKEADGEQSREGGGSKDSGFTTSSRSRNSRKRSTSDEEETSGSHVLKKLKIAAVDDVLQDIVADLNWQLSSEAFKELKQIVGELAVKTPSKLCRSMLLKRAYPRNVAEGVRYCKELREHIPSCRDKQCKHMGKEGPFWVSRRLGHNLDRKSTMQEIYQALTTSTNLFALNVNP